MMTLICPEQSFQIGNEVAISVEEFLNWAPIRGGKLGDINLLMPLAISDQFTLVI
jgi:hypothetical protein